MTADNRSFKEACVQAHKAFFETYPNEGLSKQVNMVLEALLKRRKDFPGKPGGWAAGVVLSISGPCGVPQVLNSDVEKAFGASMSTIRKRAAHVMQALEQDGFRSADAAACGDVTIRDEANAICAYAFRNGPIENLHANGQISDGEMKHVMITSCERMAELLVKKKESPDEYSQLIRRYHRDYCLGWER